MFAGEKPARRVDTLLSGILVPQQTHNKTSFCNSSRCQLISEHPKISLALEKHVDSHRICLIPRYGNRSKPPKTLLFGCVVVIFLFLGCSPERMCRRPELAECLLGKFLLFHAFGAWAAASTALQRARAFDEHVERLAWLQCETALGVIYRNLRREDVNCPLVCRLEANHAFENL